MADDSERPTWRLPRGSWALIILAALYDPLQYHAVYLPLIVPHLPTWSRFPFWYDVLMVVPPAAFLAGAGFLIGRSSRLLVAGTAVAIGSVGCRLILEGRGHDLDGGWARIEFGAFEVAATWILAMIPLALGGVAGVLFFGTPSHGPNPARP